MLAGPGQQGSWRRTLLVFVRSGLFPFSECLSARPTSGGTSPCAARPAVAGGPL